MKTLMIILALMAIAGGVLYAQGKIVKTEGGFIVKKSHTFYENKASWGEGYNDHSANTPLTGVVVLAVGSDWTYSAMTDKDGIFKIEVIPDSPFKVSISDGNEWVVYETEIPGIPKGTTVSELK